MYELFYKSLYKGSPPHTRGILHPGDLPPFVVRFTPAYAGNTLVDPVNVSPGEVHPRIRGEYLRLSTLMILA